jgi:GT2 family glycosyltransferase
VSGAPPPHVTVVICTLGSSPRLLEAVTSLLEQRTHALRIMVVDNDPGSGRTRQRLSTIDDPRLCIIEEPLRGLSRARNRALAAASTPLLAFTDDDARADPLWIRGLLDVFLADAAEGIACVTGRVLAAEVDTDEHRWFELGLGFDKGDTPHAWHLDATTEGDLEWLRSPLPRITPGPRGPVFPLSGGEFGSGNNMAFRTGWLRSNGGFDEALGAGTCTRGGEDLDIFRRVVLSGAWLVYQPAAVVVHHHRDSLEQLRAQVYGYGTGMAASVTLFAMTNPRALLRVVRSLPSALSILLRRDSQKNADKPVDYPKDLDRRERLGYLTGPILALASIRSVRRDDRRRHLLREDAAGG